MESEMTTQLNGTEFVTVENRKFAPTFEGAQARRELDLSSVMGRRHARRARRANRAL